MNEKIYDLEFYGEVYKILLEKSNYRTNGTLAINMISINADGTEEDFGVLTVNIFPSSLYANKKDMQFIDTNNLGKEITNWLVKNKIAEPCGISMPSGYCMYPLFAFNEDALKGMRRL